MVAERAALDGRGLEVAKVGVAMQIESVAAIRLARMR